MKSINKTITASFKRAAAVFTASVLCLGTACTAAFAADNSGEQAESVAASALDKDNLADGKYTLTAEMIKLDRKSYSMSNDAINHTVQLDVENGDYYITMQFMGLAIYNKFGYLQNLSYYDAGYSYGEYGNIIGTRTDAEVVSTQKNTDGTDVIDTYNDADNLYPEMVKFKLVDKASEEFVPLHVFVPIMDAISSGSGDQDVLMKLDWTALEAVEEDIVPETAATQSAAVELTDSATGVKVSADAGVFDSGVNLVVSKADVADSILSDVANSFTAYTISFTNSDGSTVTPNGKVTIYFPIGSLTFDNAALYRVNDDGTKTLVKGTVENGYYAAVQKSVGTYALIEKLASSSGTDQTGTTASTSASAAETDTSSSTGSDTGSNIGSNTGNNTGSNTGSGTASSNKTASTSSVQTGSNTGSTAMALAGMAAIGAAIFACAFRKKKNSIGE